MVRTEWQDIREDCSLKAAALLDIVEDTLGSLVGNDNSAHYIRRIYGIPLNDLYLLIGESRINLLLQTMTSYEFEVFQDALSDEKRRRLSELDKQQEVNGNED